jgi:uncharacterized coiled-coil protein SlyX
MNDASRLTNLELLFTHLERQVAELHSVVLDQQRHIELLEKQIRLSQERPEATDDEPEDEPMP